MKGTSLCNYFHLQLHSQQACIEASCILRFQGRPESHLASNNLCFFSYTFVSMDFPLILGFSGCTILSTRKFFLLSSHELYINFCFLSNLHSLDFKIMLNKIRKNRHPCLVTEFSCFSMNYDVDY